MARVDIKGDIIMNDDKWIYDWLEWDSTCPADVRKAIDDMGDDDLLDVYINSGGGMVAAGQEIYSALRAEPRTRIHVDGCACSAASLIAMAGQSDITPVGMLMVHNVSSGSFGDYHEMDKASRMLKEMNVAIANAFVVKSGKPLEEILKLMDKESWIPADKAVEYGFIDGITPPAAIEATATNVTGGIRLTDEIRQRVEAEIAAKKSAEAEKAALLKDLDLFGV